MVSLNTSYFQGSKISDKSHNQETTDLHKCISRIHHSTPEHEKHNVSSNHIIWS
jgi:thiamine pyrophosphokinase